VFGGLICRWEAWLFVGGEGLGINDGCVLVSWGL
jgi:hypothetical protein